MAELAQWMIDAGATFLDSAGNPTRPDGTVVDDPNQGGLLAQLAQQVQPPATASANLGLPDPQQEMGVMPNASAPFGFRSDGSVVPHGNIRSDGSFIGPDGRVYGADAGGVALSEIALANEQRPEMVNLGLVQVGAPSSGVTSDFSPDWQAPNRFNPADVPPPLDANDPAAQLRGTHAQTPGMLGGGNFLQDTMGSYYGVGPGDQGWNRFMASPRYFIWNSPAGPRIIDRLLQMSKNIPGTPDFSGSGHGSGKAVGWPTAFTLPGWSGGYSMVGYPGDIEGWVERG